ncbi:AtpZ/AtpI family protein [Aliiroseovarius crassostreae]|uniref:AtpZ/AtpI family protein n=1 Tax=Aliiroseovarius crassostreae TaxID=154981 RepID=UPI0022059BC2|nr:AtpZ/AtpI family protein [Aliiroseovarius crassostreae]UWQ03957.1 AtpZ/AtpI family protein [Aliiroseovarius crassostreae]
MSNDPDPERLKALEKRLKQVRGTEEKEHAGDKAYNQAQYAWQMVIELIAGLGIGFGIGYGLDALLGTKPIMMVLFIMLGFAAGVKVMLGTAAHMQKSADADAGTTPGTRSEEEEGKTGG